MATWSRSPKGQSNRLEQLHCRDIPNNWVGGNRRKACKDERAHATEHRLVLVIHLPGASVVMKKGLVTGKSSLVSLLRGSHLSHNSRAQKSGAHNGALRGKMATTDKGLCTGRNLLHLRWRMDLSTEATCASREGGAEARDSLQSVCPLNGAPSLSSRTNCSTTVMRQMASTKQAHQRRFACYQALFHDDTCARQVDDEH